MVNEKGCLIGALRQARGEKGKPTPEQIAHWDEVLARQEEDAKRVGRVMQDVLDKLDSKSDPGRTTPGSFPIS